MRDAKGRFPELGAFLKLLRRNYSSLTLRGIHDLLQDRRDAEFAKKTRTLRVHLSRVIEELRSKGRGEDRPPDAGLVKYLLWRELREGVRRWREPDWDAAVVGESVVSGVRAGGPDRLVCVPLQGSASPPRRVPNMYPLAEDVWLLERPAPAAQNARPNGLIRELQELLPELPDEIPAALRDTRHPVFTELGGLFLFPLLAYHANPVISERGHLLRKYGIPLLALRSTVVANDLIPSDDISFMSYLRPEWGPARPPGRIVQEWDSLCPEAEAGRRAFRSVFGFWYGTGLGGNPAALVHGCLWDRVAQYEVDVQNKRIIPVIYDRNAWSRPPHILVLPSVLPYDLTKKLLNAGEQMDDPTAGQLLRRIGYAVSLWERAFNVAKEEDWNGGWMHEGDERPVLLDPDALVLYSTVVLEALFSPQGDTQELSGRISDTAASCVGQSPAERYALARKLKAAYALRCDFVHGSAERRADHAEKAIWLFKIATCCLWQCVKLVVVDSTFANWDDFIDHFQRRRFGVL
jgi:hypothetical protein